MTKLKRFSKLNLKRARIDKSYSLREASDLMKREGSKIEYTTLYNYENPSSNNTPNASDMPVICEIYEKPMDYFYETPKKTDQKKGGKSK